VKSLRNILACAAACLVLAGCGGGDTNTRFVPVPVAVAPNGGDTRGPGPGGGTTTDPAVPETSAETGFDVFLLAGQSNMVGWDKNFDPVLDAPDPRILQLGFWNDHRNFVIPAIDPLDHPQRDNGVGLAMQFSRAYLNDLPKGRGILLVPSAFGGTGFYQQRWNPGNDLFEQAVERANAAMATHPSNRFAGILWHQGEDDVRFWGSQPARYAAALDAAIYGFRARIAGAASAPMILGKFTDSWGLVDTTFNAAGETTAAKANIMQAIDETTQRVPFTAVASSTGLPSPPGDPIHFSAAGQREHGLRYFAQLPHALANVPTAFAPPSAPTALSATSGASWIELRWTAPALSGRNAITGYRIAYRLSGEAAWTDTGFATSLATSIMLSGLKPDASYSVRIAAVGQAGLGTAAQLDAIATLPAQTVRVPPAAFEYAFEAGDLANTGSLGTAMNGTAAGKGVGFVDDAVRGKVMRLSQDTGAPSWVTVPRAINATAYTKSVWVKLGTYTGAQNLVSSDNQGRTAGQHTFFLPQGKPVSAGGHGQGFELVADPSGPPELDTWHHFAVTYDAAVSGGVLKLYRNGVKVSERAGVPALRDQASFFTIGAFMGGNGLNNGFLDNVRIYDSALDAGTIGDVHAKERRP
jgi:hypothetical protein